MGGGFWRWPAAEAISFYALSEGNVKQLGSSLGFENGNPPTRAGKEIRRPGGSFLERADGPWVAKPVTTKHTHMLLAEKKIEEIERRNARLGTLPGESPMECQVRQVVEPNPPLQLEMARFDKTNGNGEVREPNGYCSQPEELILVTTSAVKAFKGAGNTFIKLPAVAINASIKNYFETILWHLTPRKIIIFMGSAPGKIIPSPKIIFAWLYGGSIWSSHEIENYFCKIILVMSPPLEIISLR